jgi:hypothetical protein
MDEQQGNFKVTDRRLFNADGSPRDLPPEESTPKAEAAKPAEATTDAPVESPETAPPSEPAPETDQPAAAEANLSEEEFDERDIEDAHDPASFVNFAMSIASNAASALGMMEHPVTHKREVDLELGKHWIDVLGMLQKKTAGNLSAAEAKILESWLDDLRMQFVSLTSSAAAQPAQPFTGRDIIGGK